MKINYPPVNPNLFNEKTKNGGPSFGSLLRASPGRYITTSSFYRDSKALLCVADNLQHSFPRGATVLDYACSNGEEAISLFTMLNDRAKFSIIGVDPCRDVINLAKKGVHSVFSGYSDSFLLKNSRDITDCQQRRLRDLFYSVMEPAPEPKKPLNFGLFFIHLRDSMDDFIQRYVKIKDEFNGKLQFKIGNIKNINKVQTDGDVGAILFRNAFYHLMSDNTQDFFGKKIHYRFSETVDKDKVAARIIKKVGDKLSVGGTFSIGEHINDHIFLANRFVPENRTFNLSESPFYNSDMTLVHDIKLMGSPICHAMKEDGRFEIMQYSDVAYHNVSMRCPTVWKKIRN